MGLFVPSDILRHLLLYAPKVVLTRRTNGFGAECRTLFRPAEGRDEPIPSTGYVADRGVFPVWVQKKHRLLFQPAYVAYVVLIFCQILYMMIQP